MGGCGLRPREERAEREDEEDDGEMKYKAMRSPGVIRRLRARFSSR